MYLITLYFEEKTSRELNRWIMQVAEATDNTFMTEHQVPPHMTVGAFEAPDDETAKRLFEEMTFPAAGEAEMVSVGSFMPQVLYVSAVYSMYLHQLAVEVDKVLSGNTMVKIRPNYRPFSWYPHVTIGKQMTKRQLSTAFTVMQESFHVIKGSVVRIGLSRTNPYRDLGMRELI